MLQTEISDTFVKIYILVVLDILFFVTFAVRISLPSIFCILNNLLIQVYKRLSTTHRFVAVVLQVLHLLYAR